MPRARTVQVKTAADGLHPFGLLAVKPEDQIQHYELPHHGPQTSDRCGQQFDRLHFVAGKDEVHFMGYTHDCKEYDCGTCRSQQQRDGSWELKGWEAREAFAMRDRLQHFAESKNLSDFPTHFYSSTKSKRGRKLKRIPVYHFVMSPPQEWAKQKMWSRQGYKAMWGQLYRTAASRGIIGGVAIFHPARIPSKWNDRTCMAAGPHFHVLGFTRWGDAYDANVMGALFKGRKLTDHSRLKSTLMALGMAKRETQAVAGDGWIVKALPKRKDVASTAAYVLSHAGRPHVPDPKQLEELQGRPRRAALPASPRGTSGEYRRQGTKVLGVVPHWFGVCSYNKLKVPESAKEGILCPICSAVVPMDDWHPAEWADPGGLARPVGRFGSSSSRPWMLRSDVAEPAYSAPWEEERASNARAKWDLARGA